MTSVYMEVFGCQMNKLDAELMLAGLARDGLTVSDDPATADVVLVNTCSVREHAEEKVYSLLGRFKRRKAEQPGFVLGVVGCMAQREKEHVFRRAPYVDIVCGTDELARVPELVAQVLATHERQLAVEQSGVLLPERDLSMRPTGVQAFVSVMRGCDYDCTYCIVPAVRGHEISRDDASILDEVKRLADDGVIEVTFLGQTVNAYGKGTGSSLARLLEKTNAISGIERIRFITSHPADMTDELIDAVTSLDNVCEAISLPVQSGSNRVLRRMKRLYTVERYREIVARLRVKKPELELLTDFIVGFPGETEEDFQASAELMREVGFQTTFVFKYSPRPGTPSTRLEDDVPRVEKERRNQVLLGIQNEVSQQKNEALVGTTQEVLVVGPTVRDASRLTGRTRRNNIVIFDGAPALIGTLVPVKITAATAVTLRGSTLNKTSDYVLESPS